MAGEMCFEYEQGTPFQGNKNGYSGKLTNFTGKTLAKQKTPPNAKQGPTPAPRSAGKIDRNRKSFL